jgi:hypothetical protein
MDLRSEFRELINIPITFDDISALQLSKALSLSDLVQKCHFLFDFDTADADDCESRAMRLLCIGRHFSCLEPSSTPYQ